MSHSPLDAAFWDHRYRRHETGWDIGHVSTPLKAYFDQLTDRDKAILIPGCGNAHEALYLAELGFTDITVLDISETVTQSLRKKIRDNKKNSIKIITADFFDYEGSFDLIIEQTFFCALDPALRADYANHMASLLRPGGKLAGVLFAREFPGGPPFGGTQSEYHSLFSNQFTIHQMAPCYNSIIPRAGTELFFILVKTIP